MTTYYNYLGVAMPVSEQPETMVYAAGAGDTIYAAPGPSGLSSEDGADTMIDNVNGDVTFYAQDPLDVVEVAPGLTGVTTIYSYTQFVLPANATNLFFAGQYNWGMGNSGANLIVMTGNNADYLDGGGGNDVLVGGDGVNTFSVTADTGSDVIYNFHANQDFVRIPGSDFTSFAQIQAAMTQVGSDVVLQIDPHDTLTFRDAQISSFTAANFLMPLDMSQLGSMTFDDEFNSLDLFNPQTGQGLWQTNLGGPADALFTYQPGGNQEEEVYTSASFAGTSGSPMGLNPFSVNNGILTITATALTPVQSAEAWGQSYSSGMLTTKGVFEQQYGYFEMRAELPEGAGTWPAFWLSQDPYDRGGEADIMEHLGMYPGSAFLRAYSGVDGNYSAAELDAVLNDPDGWHTYGMLWTPTVTTFYIDNYAVMETATPTSWDQPAYMLIDLAMGGWGGPVDNSSLPAEFNIDYVRVYGLADNSQVVPTVLPTADTAAATYTAPAGVGTIQVAGATAQTITGNNAGDTIYSNNNGNILTGGTGDDQIYLGAGDTATGGGGHDGYYLEAAPAGAAAITDFNPNDVLNLYAILQTAGYASGDPVAEGYIKVTDDGSGNADVWVDPVGAANASDWQLAVVLDGQSSANVSVGANGLVTTSADAVATGGPTGAGSTGTGGTPTGGGATTGSAISTSDATYTAPAGVTDITLTGSHAQTVTGNNAGDTFHSDSNGNTLVGGTGADLFYIGQGGDTVTGGGGHDIFAVEALPWWGGAITDFGAGDTIDLTGTLHNASYTSGDPVAEGFLKITADSAGDAQIYFDPAPGSSDGSWWLVTTLDGVSPSNLTVSGDLITETGTTGETAAAYAAAQAPATSSNSGSTVSTADATYTAPAGVTDITLTGSHAQTVTGNNTGDTFHSDSNGNTLIGGTGNDTFYIGQGGDTVTGGGGHDIFAFQALPWWGGVITDFNANDEIDLTGALQKAGYTSGDAVAEGYLKFASDSSGNAQVWLNPEPSGSGSFWLVTSLEGVAAANLHANAGLITV